MTMTTTPISSSEFEFKHVRGRPERMEIIRNEFKKNIVPLYGDQTSAIQKIENGTDRSCRLLFQKHTPVGIIAYKHKPNDECGSFGQKNSLEIKTLFVIQPEINSGKGIGSRLLDYVTNKAKEECAAALHVTVSEKKPESLAFFQKKSFTIIRSCEDLYVNGVKEYVLQKLLISSVPRTRAITSSIQTPISSFKLTENDYRPITLKRPYIQMIAQGKKTIEGRINSGLFQRMHNGERIRFFSGNEEVYCQITKITPFKSFSEMLQQEGYEKLIPEARSLEAATKVYDQIPGYRERAHYCGVLALHLKVEPKPTEQTELLGKRKREEEILPLHPAPYFRR